MAIRLFEQKIEARGTECKPEKGSVLHHLTAIKAQPRCLHLAQFRENILQPNTRLNAQPLTCLNGSNAVC